MKTKLLALLLALVMVVTMLASCGGGGDNTGNGGGEGVCTSHIDKNGDKKCDACGEELKVNSSTATGDNGETLPAITWAVKPELLFQMTDNSNNEELSSGCRRFLSGELEEGQAAGFVEANAQDRNKDAEEYANVDVTYLYYSNTSDYGWGKNISKMFNAATSTTEKGRPDMFCNFVYDMVSTSLLGAFNNLYSNTIASEGVKSGELTNYFAFAKDGKYNMEYVDTGDGYMVEYMQSLTLSEHKMYLLASDYFTDLVRAFFAVPVNITLLNTIDASTEEGAFNYDYDKDGNAKYEIEDFYGLVNDQKWNYEAVKFFSDKVYQKPTDAADVLADGIYGFACAAGGLGASGLLYTTSIVVIQRSVENKEDTSDPDNVITYQDYAFNYPNNAEVLSAFVTNLSDLFNAPGVVAVNKEAGRGEINTKTGTTSELEVRRAFVNNQVLFGGIVCVGSLEDVYTGMSDGFGVVPVPLYRASYLEEGATKVDKYLTQIHNIGRVGAIGVKTTKFAQCSAFLNYQSLNSAQILDDYYEMTLKTDAAGTVKGNAEMLDYIRANVRSSFDKAFEDAVARHFFQQDDGELNNTKWHNMILGAGFKLSAEELNKQYESVLSNKVTSLEALENSYAQLP